MATVIILLTLAYGAVLTAAFMAGSSEKRKSALLWSAAGMFLSLSAGTILFFSKETIKGILLKEVPHLSVIAGIINIPWHIMVKLGMTAFTFGLIIFLLGYNCRKNSSTWYLALLWSIGIAFLLGHLLFLPQYHGIASWLNFFVPARQEEIFTLDLSKFPAFYIMLALNIIAPLFWLWHTQKTKRNSWKNILLFAGSFTGFVLILWLSAWGTGTWAKHAVDSRAARLGITPHRVAAEEPQELKALIDQEFYTKHAKYTPPRSGRYDWRKDTVPADAKAYTMQFFTSPELETYLTGLKKSAAYIAKNDVLYFSPLQHYRSLVRHRADIAELYFRSNRQEKVLPELLKYPELENLIPAHTPYMICELVRTAARAIWVTALVQYVPENKSHLPELRNLLDWSKTWQVHLPCEAGYYLFIPQFNKGKIAEFFYTPSLNTARYRGFFEAVNRIPALKKLEQQEVISGNGVFAKAAKQQRMGIVMGRTALALKIYRIEQGKYPEKLSELVPGYLPREYVSPHTGKKLGYSVTKANFTLSSDGTTITSARD